MEKLELVSMALGTPGHLSVNRKSELNQTLGFRETGNILSYELRGDSHDINREVLEMMTVAAMDILDLGTPLYSGDYTAKELAGRVAGCIDMVQMFTNEQYVSYQRIRIATGTYRCEFRADDIFRMMAEWESMMGVAQKAAYRFPCEAREEMNRSVQVKPYKCTRTFRFPSGKCVDPDEEVIRKKYGDLGRLWRTLTDEGMRKALSVAVAFKKIGASYGYDLTYIAEQMFCKKMHDDYGLKGTDAVMFDEDFFKYAPDCYRQVDEVLVRSVYAQWEEFAVANAAPAWIEKDMEVQFKNQENVTKKWQGRLKVLSVFPKMDSYAHRIVWEASVCTTKGKWSNVSHPVDRFEAYAEPEKPARGKKPEARGKKAVKLEGSEYSVKDDSGKDVTFATYVPQSLCESNPETSEALTQRGSGEGAPSFADLLRKALQAA